METTCCPELHNGVWRRQHINRGLLTRTGVPNETDRRAHVGQNPTSLNVST